MKRPTVIEIIGRLSRLREQIRSIEKTTYPDNMLDDRDNILRELYRRVFYLEQLKRNAPDHP